MTRRSFATLLFVLALCLAQAAASALHRPELACACEAEAAGVESLAEHEEEVVSEEAAAVGGPAARRWRAEDCAPRLSLLSREIRHVPRG